MSAASPMADPGAGSAALLSTRGLSVGYPGSSRPVAEGLDLNLRAGELVCLLGPNGAGKSTLIRTLAGLQEPLAGDILWEGAPRPKDPAAWARLSAIVLTERIQGGNLSVFDLAALGRHPHTGWTGRLAAADKAVVDSALEASGAWELRDRLFDTLSDGEKQKSMLARALAQEPALLLLDEPTAFLDLPRRVEAMRLLRRISREKGRAVLLSTHDLDLALRAADRLWLLSPGGRLRTGLPEDLALQGAVGEVFDQGDVAFDKRTGEFKVHGHPKDKAMLTGEPGLRFWAARALEREGYAVSPDGGSITVEARLSGGAAQWTLEKAGVRREYASLGDLVRDIRG